MTRAKAGHQPSPERMQKIREAYKEYTNPEVPLEERPTQLDLAVKYKIPQATLSYYFAKFDREGDGSKKFELQAKYPTGGTAGTVHAEICGEEE